MIQANLDAAKLMQETKRNALLQKHTRQKCLIDEIAIEKEAESAVRQKRNAIIDLKRNWQLHHAKEKEEATKTSVQSKIKQQEARLKDLADRRLKEQLANKAEKERQFQSKNKNLLLLKKVREDRLEETKRKAEEHDRKCEELKKSKDHLMKLRRKTTVEAKLKKDRLRAILDSSKNGAGIAGIKKLLQCGLMEPKKNRTGQKKQKSVDNADCAGSPPSVDIQVDTTPHKSSCVVLDNQMKLRNKATTEAKGKKDNCHLLMRESSARLLKLAEPKQIKIVQKKLKNADEDGCPESPLSAAEKVATTPHKSPLVASDDMGILIYRCRSQLVEDKSVEDKSAEDTVEDRCPR